MKNLSAFLPYVLPRAKGCPQMVARQAILDAAIDFCERSSAIQITLPPMSTEQGAREYPLFLPTKHDLVQVVRAWYKGAELDPAANENVRSATAWNEDVPGVQNPSGSPRVFYTASRNAVGLHPYPQASEDSVLTVRAAVKPTRDATQLNDDLFNDWVEVVAAGALTRLLTVPGEAYTDSVKALDFERQFFTGVQRARYVASIGRTRGELSVAMRPLA